MKLLPFLFLVVVSVTYLVAQAPSQTSTQTGIVQGIVTRDGTTEPIPDVQITISVMGGPGAVTYLSPTGDIGTMTPQTGSSCWISLHVEGRGIASGNSRRRTAGSSRHCPQWLDTAATAHRD
jgi:hypothetical protein